MTALSDNLGSKLAAKYGSIQTYTVGPTSTTIWRGASVVLHLTDGYAYPATEDTADANKQLFVGIATEKALPGAQIRVRDDGKILRNFGGAKPAGGVIGQLALILDDQTVQCYDANHGKTVLGRITEAPSETEVFVDMQDKPKRLATGLNE